LSDYTRCDAFWELKTTDRPLLAAWVGSYQAPELYPCGLAELSEGELQPGDLVFEQFVPDYESLFAAHREVGADVPWSAFPLMVVPWVEAIAGCPIYHHDGYVWAEPAREPLGQLATAGLTVRDGWLDKLIEFTTGLVALSAGRFPVALSLMRGPADLLAALRGAERSIFDLVDHPDEVQRLLAQLRPATGIHLHSAALFTVDDLVGMPGLDVIEVNLDDVGLRIPEMIPRFQQILEDKRLLVWGAFTLDDLRALRDSLPTRGLALQCIGATSERVRDLLDSVVQVWGGV